MYLVHNARSEYHTQLAKMSFDKIFDLLDGVYFNFVVVLTLTRIIKSAVTGQAPVTLELRNTPGEKINN